jgi:hypothetical protein
MKLWIIRQDAVSGYDTYDSASVAAETMEEARATHPGRYGWENSGGTWCVSPEAVIATLIGEAAENIDAGVILASFNAG